MDGRTAEGQTDVKSEIFIVHLTFLLVVINLNYMKLPTFEQNELSPLISNLLLKETKC